MTLDERAARASDGIRRSVHAENTLELHHRYRESRRRQRQRLSVVAVAAVTAVTVLAVFGLGHALFGNRQRPTRPADARGLILYGQWHPTVQESSWFTVRPDGSGVTNLHLTSSCASWWPGGRKILISDDAYAHAGHPLRPATINPDGSGLHRLDAVGAANLNLGCGQVSPDATTIVLEGFSQPSSAGINGIYTVRASDGGGLVRLTHSPPESSDGVPRFAPDGRHVVFLRMSPGPNVEGAGTLFVTTTSGGEPRRITPDGFAFSGLDWSPNGQWIVFQRPYGQLYVVHPDGTGLHRVPLRLPAGAGAQNPTWAPDGNTIAFSLVRNGQANIYTVRVDGSHLRQITHGSRTEEQMPDWSR